MNCEPKEAKGQQYPREKGVTTTGPTDTDNTKENFVYTI